MILLIDNYDSFTYNLYQYLMHLGAEVEVIRNDKVSIAQIKALSPSGIVLSPGPGKPEQAGECINIIKTFSGTIPILGVCLGHQAIAVAFGGAVIKSDEIIHGKTSAVFHNRGQLYQNTPLPFQAGRYHSLIVSRNNLPPELKVEAETSDQIIMGMRHVNHPTFGIQFHPESILSECGLTIVDNFLSYCTAGVASC